MGREKKKVSERIWEGKRMKPEDCPKFNDCLKMQMVLDKDILDWQYAEATKDICGRCEEMKNELNPEDVDKLMSLIDSVNFKTKVTTAYCTLLARLLKIESISCSDKIKSDMKLVCFDKFVDEVQNSLLGSVIFCLPIKIDSSLPANTMVFNSNPPLIVFNLGDAPESGT